MKVFMVDQKVRKLRLPQPLPRSAWIDWERAARHAIRERSLISVPFGLALIVFTVLLGLLTPWILPSRDFRLPTSFLAFPDDQKLSGLLTNASSLNTFLTASEPSQTLAQALQKEKTVRLEAKPYTLRRGDMLSTIATQNNINLGTLISFNNIRNVRKVPIGTELQIPNGDGVLYTVVSGDSLSGIARSHKVAYEAILEANGLTTPVVHPGQQVFLPGATISAWDLKQAMGELFLYPTRGYITSRFGTRKDPFTGVRTFHNGIDIANALGTPVRASMEGTVTDTGYSSAYGNYVIISHEGGFQTLYGHLKAFSVKVGQHVAQNFQIGQMGNTGYSTGNHTHFSIFKNNRAVNPLNYLF